MLQDHYEIKVTAEYIRNGVKESCRACPIALAIKAAIPGTVVSVFDSTVTIYHGKAREKASIYRHDGNDFVIDFDLGEPVEPFTLSLRRLPEAC